MNTIGIDNNLDWPRIRHLFKIGIFAAVMVLVGDMLLGFGVAMDSMTGMDGYFSKYLSVGSARIFWSAILGLISSLSRQAFRSPRSQKAKHRIPGGAGSSRSCSALYSLQ